MNRAMASIGAITGPLALFVVIMLVIAGQLPWIADLIEAAPLAEEILHLLMYGL